MSWAGPKPGRRLESLTPRRYQTSTAGLRDSVIEGLREWLLGDQTIDLEGGRA